MNTTDSDETTDLSLLFKALDISFIIPVLKYTTDATHPLSANEVAACMNHLVQGSAEYTEKTILRKLRHICDLMEDTSSDTLPARQAFALTYGGYVRTISNTASREQVKYYFEPILQSSDISMLYSSLASNRYLPDAEKEYLLHILQTLSPDKRIEGISIPEYFRHLPSRTYSLEGPQNYIDLSNTVNLLYEAIQKKKRISLTYGTYAPDKKNYRRIGFQIKNPDKPYILNPYALFWNDGYYYLLATQWNYQDVSIYRVDRIVSVEYYQSNKPERMECAKLPDHLEKYFKNYGTDTEYFDAKLYTSVHPMLQFSKEENLISCVLECKAPVLNYLVDTFGPIEILDKKIQILDSVIEHDDDQNNNGEPYYTVRIPKVQYENIVAFCCRNMNLVTPLEPMELLIQIFIDWLPTLKKYVSVLTAFSKGQSDELNPFTSSHRSLMDILMMPALSNLTPTPPASSDSPVSDKDPES